MIDPDTLRKLKEAGLLPVLNMLLDQQQRERDETISKLRRLDESLIEFGRLKRETLPRRVR